MDVPAETWIAEILNPLGSKRGNGRNLLRWATGVWLAGALAGFCAESAAPTNAASMRLRGTVPTEGVLPDWLQAVRERHPELQAARMRVLAARRRAEAVGAAFHDPVLQSSAGLSDGPGEAPHVTMPRVLPTDAFSAQGGIEAPIGAGLYGGAGLSLRRLDVEGERDGATQVTGGGRLRMPLLRDRGYRGMQLDAMLRDAELRQAEAAAARTAEDLTRDLVVAYAAWLQQIADAREVGKAMERAEKLLEETAERAKLEVVPGYQVFPARFEAALRLEELESAREQTRSLRRTLTERLGRIGGAEEAWDAGAAPDLLVRWAEALAARGAVPATAIEEICARRAEHRELEFRILAAEARVRMAAEALRSDLSLQAGLHWDRDNADATPDAEEFGYEVAIAFRRTLSRRGERAQIEAAKADLDSLLAELSQLQVRLSAEVSRTRIAWEGACVRLALARSAVAEAGRVLAAEDERFALGEGSSRNVLDAQKDLTAASRRHVAVAGQVVSALAELRHALGLPQDGEGS